MEVLKISESSGNITERLTNFVGKSMEVRPTSLLNSGLFAGSLRLSSKLGEIAAKFTKLPEKFAKLAAKCLYVLVNSSKLAERNSVNLQRSFLNFQRSFPFELAELLEKNRQTFSEVR